MQVDGTTFGIIPDNFNTILQNYLTNTTSTFPDASNPSDPAYVLMYQAAIMDQLNEAAEASLWNSINANTASGTGLDILADNILNLTRLPLIPSSAGISVTLSGIRSTCVVQIIVTGSGTIPIGWQATGFSTLAPYATTTSTTISASGTYLLTLSSTDTSTPVPANSFTGGDAVSGITFTSVTNPASAILGSFTIPTTWGVTATSLGSASPVYSPSSDKTFTADGTYNFIVYSQDIVTPIYATQLDKPTDRYNNTITTVTNALQANLGSPAETDAQFQARRDYYLNVDGQTFYGLEKAILNLNVPGLTSVFVAETVSDTYNASILIVKVSITYSGSPVVIPVGWTVSGTGTPPSPLYATNQSYTYGASGDYYIPTFSTDTANTVAIGSINSATPTVTGVTAVTNLVPSIPQVTVGLGQRGYTVYLKYPTIGGGGFDVNDPYLQEIAQTAFDYHALGTQFYAGAVGSTLFTVQTPYSGYTGSVYLNPFQNTEVTCNLNLVYNVDPQDAGFNGAVFPYTALPTLQTAILEIINDYFNSKTLPTDLVYTIQELSTIINNTYPGIVDLLDFTFGTLSPTVTGLVWLRRQVGYTFNLLNSNFTFVATNKDSL